MRSLLIGLLPQHHQLVEIVLSIKNMNYKKVYDNKMIYNKSNFIKMQIREV